MKAPFERFILVFLLAFVSLGAIYGGGSMLLSPDGSLLGMDVSWLEKSPFSSFLIPGLILFFFLGFVPLITIVGLLTRKPVRLVSTLNMFPGTHWSWSYSLYISIMIMIWISVQQLMTDYYPFQPIIALTGTAILIILMLPKVQRYYQQL